MTNSIAQKTSIQTSGDEENFEYEVWLVIDRDERPDLIKKIKEGSLHLVINPLNGDEMGVIDAPILVFQPNYTPPLIFAPAKQTTENQDRDHALGLVNMLRQKLGDRWKDSWMDGGLDIVPVELLPHALDDYDSVAEHLSPTLQLRSILQQLQTLPNIRENIPQRISLLKNSLQLVSKQEDAALWAMLQADLATTLSQNPAGNHSDNIEDAISKFEETLSILRHNDNPMVWASIQSNLANIYAERIKGSRNENIEQAIYHYQQALSILRETGNRYESAQVMYSLANAFVKRQVGDNTDNLERALTSYEQALSVFEEMANTQDVVRTKNNIAQAYLKRAAGDKQENLKKAIAAFEQVLEYSQEADPQLRDSASMSLATALSELEHLKDEMDSEIKLSSEESEDNTSGLPVQFSCFYSRSVIAEKRQIFLVYAHIPDCLELIKQNVSKFEDEFTNGVPNPKTSKQSNYLKISTPITVTLECPDQEFEPLAITKKWRPDWIRFDFDFFPLNSLVDDTLIVRVSIRVYGIEIASIDKCAIEVVADSLSDVEVDSHAINNPIAMAKLQSQTTEMYNKIFVSYAREDTDVVESYRLAQLAAGHDVFMDTHSIRSGEDWKQALAFAIDSADIFQLFWSENSSKSEFVQYEWDYAMNFRCKDDGCRSFIRPVYWKKPMPDPPIELKHLNFSYVPFGLAGESLEWRLYHDEFWGRMESYFQVSNVILKKSLRDLKRGQRAIYRRLERSYADELNEIMNALQDNKITQTEITDTLQDIKQTLYIMRKYNVRLDKRVQEAVEDLTDAVDSNLGMQQKLELALPIVPFFLDYKVELGAGSDVDLNKVWDELKERWSRLISRVRGQAD